MIEVIEATEDHCWAMAPHLRAADVRECWAGWRHRPAQALVNSWAVSTCAWTATNDGRPIAMWGAGPLNLLAGEGTAWLLATPEAEAPKTRFLRLSQHLAPHLFTDYQILRNYVDARNIVSIRWLRWLGATFDPPAPFGPDRLPFRRFEMRADHV